MMKYVIPAFLFVICMPAFGAGLDADSPKTIEAETIEYSVREKSIKTYGKTTITNESGQKLTLLDAYIGQKNTDAAGRSVDIYLSKQVHMSAATIDKRGDQTIARHATYTTCANCGDNAYAWEISATELQHDNVAHEMTFYNPVLWFYETPIFWFPVMDYPDPTVKYKSGLLFPSLNSTNNMGIQINIPVYVNFSNYHDATITMSYLTKENPLWQVEHRMNVDHAAMNTRGSFTHTNDGNDRWHIFNKDRVDLGEHARAFLFLNRTSDKTYLQQYDFYNDQPYLDSGARFEFFADGGYMTTETHFFQELRSLNNGNFTKMLE
jgi:LPS-assembly protein